MGYLGTIPIVRNELNTEITTRIKKTRRSAAALDKTSLRNPRVRVCNTMINPLGCEVCTLSWADQTAGMTPQRRKGTVGGGLSEFSVRPWLLGADSSRPEE